MRIEGSSRSNPAAARSSTARAGGSDAVFKVDLGESIQRAQNVASVSATAGLDALLALQSVDDPVQAKRRSVRRGRSLLDTLERIKADLLTGSVTGGQLDALAGLLRQARQASEPGLDALLDDIELRVRVELAKFGRYPD